MLLEGRNKFTYETVFITGDGNTIPARPEEIVSLAKRQYGIDNETTNILFDMDKWKDYLQLCREFRIDGTIPSLKQLQNEDIVSKDGYAKSGLIMFKDDYDRDDTLICCRLWKGKKKTGYVLDSERFKGPLSTVFRETMSFIERNTKTGWKKMPNGGRGEIRAFPKEAVREALVNAVAHRDYSIAGTQIDVDIYDDRMDIVSPGSWLLPRKYEEYPLGSIPSIRRNGIIAACLDVANLMERGGTGFQTIIESYSNFGPRKQPVILIYPRFLNLRLPDTLYKDSFYQQDSSDKMKVMESLNEGPKAIRELQALTKYKSRSGFLDEVINPLMDEGRIVRDGNAKSPYAKIRLTDE